MSDNQVDVPRVAQVDYSSEFPTAELLSPSAEPFKIPKRGGDTAVADLETKYSESAEDTDAEEEDADLGTEETADDATTDAEQQTAQTVRTIRGQFAKPKFKWVQGSHRGTAEDRAKLDRIHQALRESNATHKYLVPCDEGNPLDHFVYAMIADKDQFPVAVIRGRVTYDPAAQDDWRRRGAVTVNASKTTKTANNPNKMATWEVVRRLTAEDGTVHDFPVPTHLTVGDETRDIAAEWAAATTITNYMQALRENNPKNPGKLSDGRKLPFNRIYTWLDRWGAAADKKVAPKIDEKTNKSVAVELPNEVAEKFERKYGVEFPSSLRSTLNNLPDKVWIIDPKRPLKADGRMRSSYTLAELAIGSLVYFPPNVENRNWQLYGYVAPPQKKRKHDGSGANPKSKRAEQIVADVRAAERAAEFLAEFHKLYRDVVHFYQMTSELDPRDEVLAGFREGALKLVAKKTKDFFVRAADRFAPDAAPGQDPRIPRAVFQQLLDDMHPTPQPTPNE